jgi:peptide/nickel transport system substrate-binding protein
MVTTAAAGLAIAGVAGRAHAQAPKRGGTLRSIVNPEPPGLILGLNQLLPTMLVAGKIYQGLLRYGFDLKPLPSLAKSWTISPDGKVYTFKLEEAVTWHDGQPFTSADVVFSTTKYLPETHARWRAMRERCASIEAIDPHTVAFTLKETFSPFISAFLASGCPMMRRTSTRGRTTATIQPTTRRSAPARSC